MSENKNQNSDTEKQSPNGTVKSTPKRSMLWKIAFLFVVIGALPILGLAAVMILFSSENIPPLTQLRLADAMKKWETNQPAHYELEIEVQGNLPGVYVVEVKNGEPIRATVNGRVPHQARVWHTWKVYRQFDFIQRELDGAAQPEKVFNAPGATVDQRAEFDEKFGYPKRYLRIVYGTPQEISWEVKRFEVLHENSNSNFSKTP